jgi:hypothetical protein
MSNVVEVTIQGSDQLTGQLGKLRQAVKAMSFDFPGISNGVNNGLRTVSPNWQTLLKVDLLSSVIQTAVSGGLSAAAAGFSKMMGSLTSAAGMETLDIARSVDMSSKLGMSRPDASKMLEGMQIELSNKAAVLPGSTADYVTIMGMINDPLLDASKGNAEVFKKLSQDLSTQYGAIAGMSGANAQDGGSALSRAIQGTMGLGELGMIDLFQKNGAIMKSIRDQLKEQGKTSDDWKNLTNEERAGMLSKAGSSIMTPEKLAAFNGSTDGLIQGIRTTLFDPRVGLFGVMRRLPDGRHVLAGFNGLLTSLTGLGSVASDVANRLGISFDPMAKLLEVMDGIAWLGKQATKVLESNKNQDIGGLFTGILNGLSGMVSGLLEGMNMFVIRGVQALAGTDTAQVAYAISSGLSGLMGWLSGALAQVNWGNLGTMVGLAVASGFMVLGQALLSPNLWVAAVQLLETMSNAAIAALGGLVGGAISKLTESVVSTVNSWKDALIGMFQGLMDIIRGIVDTVRSKIPFAGGGAPAAPIATPLATPEKLGPAAPFAPQVNVSATTNADPVQIGSAVSDHIGKLYRQYETSMVG